MSQASDFVAAGDEIAGRFRLDRLLNRRGLVQSWLAHDSKLGRPVLAHLLPPGAPRTAEILDAARAAAALTDSRVLRVFDALPAHGRAWGACVVCEYAGGRTLQAAVARGPLSELEACWVVRNVADALVTLHAMGLYHRHLGGDTVVLTDAAEPKIVAFSLAAALTDQPVIPDGERADVQALGRLLELASGGASAAVGDVANRVLHPGASRRPALTTAVGVSTALGELLGGRDPSAALGVRLRTPPPPPPQLFTPVPPPSASDHETTQGIEVPGEPTAPIAVGRPAVLPPDEPEPPPATAVSGAEPSASRFTKALAVVFGASLVVGLAGVFVGTYQATQPGPGRPVLAVASARDFDPKADGGDDSENPGDAKATIDGQASTAWLTERYGRSANFNGRKPGVGVLLDLGAERTVTSVRVTLTAGPTDLELRVPKDAASAPSLKTQADWASVAATAGASGEVAWTLAQPAKTRYLLVYVTKLPPAASGVFQAGVAEVVVGG